METQGLLGAGTEARLRVARACESARRGGLPDRIIQAYLGPNRTLHEVLDDVHQVGFHFFTEFGEACRQDLGRD